MHSPSKSQPIIPLLAVFAAVQPVIAHSEEPEKGKWSAGAGIDYSSGSYGDDADTDILFLPVNASYQRGAWTTKITIPWLQIKGPGSVIGGGDSGVVTGGGEEIDASGLGDIWLQETFELEAIPAEWFYLDLVGKVKFPTANADNGLGTGAFDYTLQLDLFKPIGKLSPMATVAYKIKGDTEDSKLNNVFYLSLGADYRINDAFNFGTTLDYQEASSSAADESLEIFSYLGWKVSKSSLVTAYSYFGLSDGSPDAGGGLQWKYRF